MQLLLSQETLLTTGKEKKKCRKGVIYKSGDKVWYIARDYYMWLNFLPIFNKEIQKFGFADIRDAQYHMALYEMLAELNFKHVAILKKTDSFFLLSYGKAYKPAMV